MKELKKKQIQLEIGTESKKRKIKVKEVTLQSDGGKIAGERNIIAEGENREKYNSRGREQREI